MNVEALASRIVALTPYALESVQPLGAESRNPVARVYLSCEDERRTAILKFYTPGADRFWDHRFRREEKVLTLLASARPPVAPGVLAGFIRAGGPAMLLMEDAGEKSLADTLLESGSLRLWYEAAEFLCGLHAEMERLRPPLKRTAMSINLDRISAGVLKSRLRIAGTRVLGKEPEPGVLRDILVAVSPLLTAPKAMIHNSMSPLNVVRGPEGWRAIDWETLTWASPFWDWAELLRAPYHPLDFEVAEALALSMLENSPASRGVKEREMAGLFRRAVLSRHLDSLATVVQRRKRYIDEDRPDRAAEYARRAAFYAADLRAVAERLVLPDRLNDWLVETIGSATQ